MLKNNIILKKIYLKVPHFLKNVFASFYSVSVAKKKYGKHFFYWQQVLCQSQFWDQSKIENFKLSLLREFLVDAVSSSPFYRRIVEANNIDSTNIDSVDIIKKFPIIDKKIVLENYDSIKNIENKKCLKFTSSGTTGTSLSVYISHEAYQREYAFRWHYLSVAGAKRRSRFAYFLGNYLILTDARKPPFHIKDYFENSVYFSIFHMSDTNMFSYVKVLNEFKPNYIKGYPSALYILSEFIAREKLTVFHPQAIFCASEMLRDYQKEKIENVFSCPIFQWYGQVETTINIHECEYHKFHVKEEYGLLELLRDDGSDAQPGEIANVVGTGWGNSCFPLIRYNTGDNMILARDQNCKCQRNGRIIEEIVGRDEDVVITSDGRKIGRLDFIFKPIESVLESQIIQDEKGDLLIKVVPLRNFSEHDESTIIKKIDEYIGGTMNVKIEKVQSIERTKSGKIRYVISKLNQH